MNKPMAIDEVNQDVPGCIYLATTKSTGKKYVGQTTSTLRKRIFEHYQGTTVFDRTIRKFKKHDTEWFILELTSDPIQLDLLEAHHIKKHHSFTKGYNSNRGKTLDTAISITAQKIDRLKSLYGTEQVICSTTKQKFDNFELAAKCFDIACTDALLACRGFYIEGPNRKKFNFVNIELRNNADTLRKMRKEYLKRQKSFLKDLEKTCKPVYCKQKLEAYYSISEAAEDSNTTSQRISASCHGKTTDASGYTFGFI